MSSVAYYVLLALGGLAVGLLVRLVPKVRNAMILPMTLLLGAIFAVGVGSFFEGHDVGDVLTMIGLTAVWLVFISFGSGQGSSHSGSDWGDSGDSGDGGGGDGGGGNGGGGD